MPGCDKREKENSSRGIFISKHEQINMPSFDAKWRSENNNNLIIMIETFEKVDSFLKILKFNIVISSSALKVDSSRRFPLKGSRNWVETSWNLLDINVSFYPWFSYQYQTRTSQINWYNRLCKLDIWSWFLPFSNSFIWLLVRRTSLLDGLLVPAVTDMSVLERDDCKLLCSKEKGFFQ